LIELPATPAAVTEDDGAGNRAQRAAAGRDAGPAINVREGPVGVLRAAVHATWGTVRMMVDVIGQIIGGQRSASELGGPLKIAQYSGQTVSMGLLPLVEHFMALISINLGFINLLPIPMLDGGHLFFYLIEGVRRRPLPAQAQEWAFRSGLALLLAFMLFVTVNDLGVFRPLAKACWLDRLIVVGQGRRPVQAPGSRQCAISPGGTRDGSSLSVKGNARPRRPRC
jgi:regulator of sigma E protease